jgi:hypothetical protein
VTVVRWLWRLSVATALALLSLSITSAAALAAPPEATQIYTYDSPQPPAGLADIATERGPPASHARDIAYDAVDWWSHGDSVGSNGPVAGSTPTYDAPPTVAQVARASSTTCGQAGTLNEHPSSLQPWHAAAETGDGLLEGEQYVYRVHSGDARPWGHSWTPENPMGMANPRDTLGLPKANSGQLLTRARVESMEGVTIQDATAIPEDV